MPVSCQMCSNFKANRCQLGKTSPNQITSISMSSLLGFCDELTLKDGSEEPGGGP